MPLYKASTSSVTLPITESDVTSLTSDLAAKGSATTVAAHDAALWLPSDHGYLAWTVDPAIATSSTILATAGVLYGVKLKLGAAATISTISIHVTTAGNTLTNTFVALYDSGGTRRGVSANQSSVFNSSGLYDVALTGSYAATAGTYYVAVLCGSASTMPTLNRGANSTVLNDGLAASDGFRCWSSGTGQTAAPASVTLSGTAAVSQNFWFALK